MTDRVAFLAQAQDCQQRGRLGDAEQACRLALSIYPDFADILQLLGVVACQTGNLRRAEILIRHAITLDERQPHYHSNIAFIFGELGEHAPSVQSCRKALVLAPGFGDAYLNLGLGLYRCARLQEAERAARRAMRIAPNVTEAHNNLGLVLQASGRLPEAIDCYRRALSLDAGYLMAHTNLGSALQADGAVTPARAAYRKALVLKPDSVAALVNIGAVERDTGRLTASRDAYRRAIEIEPDNPHARSGLLLTMHYSPDVDAEDLLAAARCHPAVKTGSRPALRSNGNPLRIGYVSGDLRSHPVGYFFEQVLQAHNPSAVRAICYSNSPVQDKITTRLKRAASGWHDIAGLQDTEAAALIEQDAIDILVDLSGHTGGNRLSLFSLRPAPIQVSWLGYFGTTGLPAIDYVLADRVVAPEADDIYFSEKVLRLPGCYLCYAPPEWELPIGPPPSAAEGSVTFGCFNNWSKVNDEVVALWASILGRVAGSRLFLKSRVLGDPDCRADAVAQFAAHSIGEERLIIEGRSPLADALAAYNRVDVALDPFPFGGGTTTAETLWMGVPLVALRGRRWVGRTSQSILSSIGIDDWVADDPRDYADIACYLAASLHIRVKMREELRSRMQKSAFCDGPGFTRSLEAAFQEMHVSA